MHLQDLGQLPWAQDLIRKADKVVMFMRNHQFTQSLLREFSTKELIKPAVTRFGTNLIMIDRLIEQKEALQVRLLGRQKQRPLSAKYSWFFLAARMHLQNMQSKISRASRAVPPCFLCNAFAMHEASQLCKLPLLLAENGDRQAVEGVGRQPLQAHQPRQQDQEAPDG